MSEDYLLVLLRKCYLIFMYCGLSNKMYNSYLKICNLALGTGIKAIGYNTMIHAKLWVIIIGCSPTISNYII